MKSNKNSKWIIVFSFVVIVGFIFGEGKSYAKVNFQAVKIEVDFCDENTSKANTLYWGSELGLSAKNTSDKKIKWKISNDGSKEIELLTTEYSDKKGNRCIKLYAPFGYCDDLTIAAISEKSKKVLATYSLKVVNGTKWNGETFFEFDMNIPEEKQLDGDKTQINEQWDIDTQQYKITLPEPSCKVEGYTFIGWRDKNGKVYKPNEELSVKYTGESVYYTICAEWRKNNSSTNVTAQPEEKKNSEKEESIPTAKTIFSGGIIGALVIGILIVGAVVIVVKNNGNKQ